MGATPADPAAPAWRAVLFDKRGPNTDDLLHLGTARFGRIDRSHLGSICFGVSDRRAYEAADQYLRAVFLIPDLS
jgi:hypothetical protein